MIIHLFYDYTVAQLVYIYIYIYVPIYVELYKIVRGDHKRITR